MSDLFDQPIRLENPRQKMPLHRYDSVQVLYPIGSYRFPFPRSPPKCAILATRSENRH